MRNMNTEAYIEDIISTVLSMSMMLLCHSQCLLHVLMSCLILCVELIHQLTHVAKCTPSRLAGYKVALYVIMVLVLVVLR